MPRIINLNPISDSRGSLTVIQDELDFEVKRVFYIYGVPNGTVRGGHRHKKTVMALVCLNGECLIDSDNGTEKTHIKLNSPSQCLILNPEDWHEMTFNQNAILLVLSSEKYSKEDYIYERY